MATPPVFVSGAVLTAAQMNDIGLWLVAQQSFSAVSTTNANGVFTSDFTCYRILFRATSTVATVGYRLRASGVAESGSVYAQQTFRARDTGSASTSTSTGTSGATSFDDANIRTDVWLQQDFYGPQLTVNTYVMSNFFAFTAGTNLPLAGFVANRLNTSTAYDGIEFNVASGTMTGELFIYGYNK